MQIKKVLKVLLLLGTILKIKSQNADCDFYQLMDVEKKYEIFSRDFKNDRGAKSFKNCRWAAETQPGYRIKIKCDSVCLLLPNILLLKSIIGIEKKMFSFQLPGCSNKLTISRRGRVDLADGEIYCGYMGSISLNSESTKMTISLKMGRLPLGSRFRCYLMSELDPCICGTRNQEKIVGGNESVINEFPSMAGLIDETEGIYCGATISD